MESANFMRTRLPTDTIIELLTKPGVDGFSWNGAKLMVKPEDSHNYGIEVEGFEVPYDIGASNKSISYEFSPDDATKAIPNWNGKVTDP